jgi:threonine aldolase
MFKLRKSGMTASRFTGLLAARKVLAVGLEGERVRVVTHLNVDRNGMQRAAAAIREVMSE